MEGLGRFTGSAIVEYPETLGIFGHMGTIWPYGRDGERIHGNMGTIDIWKVQEGLGRFSNSGVVRSPGNARKHGNNSHMEGLGRKYLDTWEQ